MAATYTILSKTTTADSVSLNVQYVFSYPDVAVTTTVNASINYYQPQTLTDITTGITNRATSEIATINSAATIAGFYNSIITNAIVTID
jgi:hypothetical protein